MKKMAIVLGIVLLLGGSAQACGRGRRCCVGARRHVAYYSQPVLPARPAYLYPAPRPAAPPATQAAPVSVQPATQAAPVSVQPAYRYEAGPTGRPAYYYTYDESGKLIVQQWVDWVFRGGREAGMPRPPMPVIGWFVR
jgi:hypothetical protein